METSRIGCFKHGSSEMRLPHRAWGMACQWLFMVESGGGRELGAGCFGG